MASAINASTTDGLQIISDTSSDFEFQRDGVTIAGFTSTGLANAGLQNSTISINGTSVALGGTADLEQDCMHAWVDSSGGTNPVSTSGTGAQVPLVARENHGSMTLSGGSITVGRAGLYFVMVSFLINSSSGHQSGDGRIRLNGSNVAAFYAGAKDWNTWEKSTGTAIMRCNANDVISIVSVGNQHYHWTLHSNVSVMRVGD